MPYIWLIVLVPVFRFWWRLLEGSFAGEGSEEILLLSPNAPRIWLALLVRDRVRDAYWNDLELARLNLVALDTLRELDLEWRGGWL